MGKRRIGSSNWHKFNPRASSGGKNAIHLYKGGILFFTHSSFSKEITIEGYRCIRTNTDFIERYNAIHKETETIMPKVEDSHPHVSSSSLLSDIASEFSETSRISKMLTKAELKTRGMTFIGWEKEISSSKRPSTVTSIDNGPESKEMDDEVMKSEKYDHVKDEATIPPNPNWEEQTSEITKESEDITAVTSSKDLYIPIIDISDIDADAICCQLCASVLSGEYSPKLLAKCMPIHATARITSGNSDIITNMFRNVMCGSEGIEGEEGVIQRVLTRRIQEDEKKDCIKIESEEKVEHVDGESMSSASGKSKKKCKPTFTFDVSIKVRNNSKYGKPECIAIKEQAIKDILQVYGVSAQQLALTGSDLTHPDEGEGFPSPKETEKLKVTSEKEGEEILVTDKTRREEPVKRDPSFVLVHVDTKIQFRVTPDINIFLDMTNFECSMGVCSRWEQYQKYSFTQLEKERGTLSKEI
ncbi:hypothetical protein ADUPG1_007877 [Aduncisulcus paluster]|uniref:Uncharacterized protein n=1 Tax=Aduncisulcus paluster TaxID=2918883 RepID=A0ABQ5KSZ2_9EUKA|nr:hypothetical protein ADUPG1_007877 [Aduncisulcus paluster]